MSATPSRRRVDSLDGLRAVAVLLVVGFHLGVPGLQGGFLGVDVFFVLSGFLISTLLIKEAGATGRIDLGRFWTRRMLRLLPAATSVILAVCIWGLVWAEPYRRRDIGTDALWSVGYVANWRFIQTSSYFADTGVPSPLLHVWSLAVEEQFYLVWPTAITVLGGLVWRRMRLPQVRDSASRAEVERRRKDAVAASVGGLALVAALASAVWLGVLYDPAAPERAYMGTDTKIVEPLIGAVAAALMTRPRLQRFTVRHHEALMGAGLAGAAVGVATLAGPAPVYFSGGAVLFSIVTALLVAAATAGGNGHVVARTLGWAPLAYLGRISYGIYLWHWPVALWVLHTPQEFRPWPALVVLVTTVAVASASYHLLEVPIRRGALSRLRPSVLIPAVGVSMAAVATVAFTVTSALPLGLGPGPASAASGSTHEPRVDRSTVVVIGDSVASRLVPALAAEGERRGMTILTAARGGCPALPIPVVDADGVPLSKGACTTTVPAVQERTIADADPGVVLMWSRYELADRLGPDGRVLRAGSPEFWAAQRAAFLASVDRWTAGGATLVVVQTDRPGVGLASRCRPQDCHPFLQRIWHRDDLRRTWNRMVAEVAAQDPRVRTLRIDDVYCRDAGVPCDDSLPIVGGVGAAAAASPSSPPAPTAPSGDRGDRFAGLARPDGSHFSPAAAPPVAAALLDRLAAATR